MEIRRYFLQKRTVLRTTWLGKLLIGFFLFLLVYVSRGLWLDYATSFISAKDTASPADAIVIENWNYPARINIKVSLQLLSDNMGKTIFVTEYPFSKSNTLSGAISPPYYYDILSLLFKGEGYDFGKVKMIPVLTRDPVTWNTALTVIETIAAQGCRSMILVSPWHHSRRSCDAYTKAGEQKGVKVFCKPVEGYPRKDDWWKSDIGLSTVFSEIIKRIYYMAKVI
jgi:hypothetical protein